MSLRDLRRHVGRLAVVGFSGTTVPEDLRRLVAEFDLGGVIYFSRNVESPEQVAELSREVADLAVDWPLWIGVDQEGGRVARLKKPFTEWPPMLTLGRSGDETLAARFAEALAAELAAVGITVDFTPVLDVWTNPANKVIGDRALATSAADVARLGCALIRSLQQHGIAACGKHFPGHGDTVADSHDELPIVEHDRRRIESIELVPFVAAIAEGVSMIMTAHVLVPAIDPNRPASLSPAIVSALLKNQLGFDGVVVSDDLGMKAVAGPRSLPEAALAAIQAGNDVVLLCNSTIDQQAEVLETLIRAAESGRLSQQRIDDALDRQHAVKSRPEFKKTASPSRPPLNVIGSEAHHAVAREMAGWL